MGNVDRTTTETIVSVVFTHRRRESNIQKMKISDLKWNIFRLSVVRRIASYNLSTQNPSLCGIRFHCTILSLFISIFGVLCVLCCAAITLLPPYANRVLCMNYYWFASISAFEFQNTLSIDCSAKTSKTILGQSWRIDWPCGRSFKFAPHIKWYVFCMYILPHLFGYFAPPVGRFRMAWRVFEVLASISHCTLNWHAVSGSAKNHCHAFCPYINFNGNRIFSISQWCGVATGRVTQTEKPNGFVHWRDI